VAGDVYGSELGTVDLICLITNGLYETDRKIILETSVCERSRVGWRLKIKGRLSREAGSTVENDYGVLGTT